MDINERFRKAHKVVRDVLKLSLASILIAQLLATVVFPIAEVVLRGISALPVLLLPTVYALHVIVAGYGLYGLNKMKDFIRLADLDEIEQQLLSTKEQSRTEQAQWERECETRQQKLRTLECGLAALAAQATAVQGSLSVMQELLSQTDAVRKEDTRNVASLLGPVIQRRSEVLGFGGDDLYNCAVYVYDQDKDLLVLLYRDCDNRIRRQDRNWKPGTGHIGLAFAQNRTIITGNVAHSPDVFPPNTNAGNQYVSIISTPIPRAGAAESEPMGVLAITSSRGDHFDLRYQTLAESYAIMLAIYLSRARMESFHE